MKNLPEVKKDLIQSDVVDELLLYDAHTERAHCLSLIGKLVFKACERGALVEELESELSARGVTDPEAAIEESLNQLAEQSLLASSEPKTFDRRRFLALAGPLAALPVVASVVAPRPAHALSCNNCAIDASNIPLSCSSCLGPCPAGTCTGVALCCFEYTLFTSVNGGAGQGCINAEGSGEYRCRGIAALTHSYDCGTARDMRIANGGVDFDLYYCCYCSTAPGHPSIHSC